MQATACALLERLRGRLKKDVRSKLPMVNPQTADPFRETNKIETGGARFPPSDEGIGA